MSKLKIKDGEQWTEIPAGGIGVPSGGDEGQYLVKSSSADYATEWADLPTEVSFYKNFADIDGVSYINATNWQSWHTAIYVKNGWGMIVIDGASNVAMAAGTEYELADIPASIIQATGETSTIGFAHSGTVFCELIFNTWNGAHRVSVRPTAALAASKQITGTCVFVIGL